MNVPGLNQVLGRFRLCVARHPIPLEPHGDSERPLGNVLL